MPTYNGHAGGNGRRSRTLNLPEVPQAAPTLAEWSAADRVLARYPQFQREQLLALLLDVQAETGWLSEELTRYLSQKLNVPFADLYGVISFYGLLKTTPAGRTVVRVCNGVPCRLHGAREVGQHLEALLGVGPGEPTRDGQFSWEWFPCLGQCDFAPAALVGEEALRQVTAETLDAVVREAGNARTES